MNIIRKVVMEHDMCNQIYQFITYKHIVSYKSEKY